MVVTNPEGVPQRVASGYRLGQEDFDDFALLATRFSNAAASVVLMSKGEGMQVVGSHGCGTARYEASHLHGNPHGEKDLYTLASVHLRNSGGTSIGLLVVLGRVQHVLSPSQHELLYVLSRQLTAVLELRRQNVTDALTGLANRRAFESRLAEEVERARRYNTTLSLLMIDVDDFKGYNDAFGHPAGDEVLRQLAMLLLENVRASDLVTRYGGEEFAVIVPESEIYSALFLAERCRHTVEVVHWPHRGITVSIGVASLPRGTEDGSDLLEAADQALYQAKRRGGNRTARASSTWRKTKR